MKSEETTDRKHKSHLIKYIQEMKSSSPCLDCKLSYPYYVMDFDHVRGRKQKNVMELINTLSKKKIDEEIAKCEIVCSNCHRIRTHKRRAGKNE
jgi:lysyl-tRNA synthetase class I